MNGIQEDKPVNNGQSDLCVRRHQTVKSEKAVKSEETECLQMKLDMTGVL